ncbi:MAG: DNA-directed RNA polymerase, subunit E'' [Candidatus Brockarchaeota archaeon]|nr:DNA-directed RNA polymerase, subunit E'' [Candidatus Brockarchaeota archaeon]
MVEKACTKCHLLTTENVCPNCKTSSFSTDWSGVALVMDVERSEIAKRLGVKKKGRYAIKVR